jgi:tetratricopeptide (TPR) repeat protein
MIEQLTPPSRRAKARLAMILALFTFVAAGFAQSTTNPVYAARAENAFRQAQIQFESSTNAAAAWQFARACFDFADFATNDTQRADIARLGIAACQQLLRRDTNSAPADYYLAMNYGQLAQAEAPSLAAYRLVRQIEHEFQIAADLDESFDYAGPERGLGLLYRDAPGWPLSIGSRSKARELLEEAVKLAPNYPENLLNLVEAYLQWHEKQEAENELKELDVLWPVAQTNFTGQAWEQNWDDWSRRRDAAREKTEEMSEPLTSPRNSR